MALTTPDWLTRHDGALREGADGRTWFVLLGDEPQYRVTPIPAGGKYSCDLVQTINGRRLDKGTVYATAEEAVRGCLEELRQVLGW